MASNTITQSAPLFSSIKYGIVGGGPIIVADGFKSPENMGHLIRLASNFGAVKVIFIGEEHSVRHSKLRRVAGAAAGQIQWMFCSMNEWLHHIPKEYTIAAIETSEDSLNIADSKLPEKLALVMGNEIRGLSEEVLSKCQQCYHIPMIGAIKSMNVSHACSVALYEWMSQHYKVEL